MKRSFLAFRSFVKRITAIQARIVLFLIFFVFVFPISLILKLFSYKRFISSQSQKNSCWIKRKEITNTFEWAKKQ